MGTSAIFMRRVKFCRYFENLELHSSLLDQEFFSKAYLGVLGRYGKSTLIMNAEAIHHQMRNLNSVMRLVLSSRSRSIMIISGFRFVGELANRLFLDDGAVCTYELSNKGFISIGTRGPLEMVQGPCATAAIIFIVGLNSGPESININTVVSIFRKISCSPIVVFDDSGPIIQDLSVYSISASVRTEVGASFWLNLIKYLIDSRGFYA